MRRSWQPEDNGGMGPSIILDKSAVESIGDRALRVQSDHFYTVVTPILVWEVCGDIEKARLGRCDETKVRALARKAHPFDSIVTMDWRKVCLGELSGYRLDEYPSAGNRRAMVDGAHRVPLPSGGYGAVIDQQPEADALLRWQVGERTPSDAEYAQAWRRLTKAIDLDTFKRRFGPARQPAETFDELKSIVDKVLTDPSLQYFLLTLLVEEITTDREKQRQLLKRWTGVRASTWQSQARFSRHCIRTFLTFYLALGSGLVGTRATNRVDVEYLLYLPFAPIFISGDEGTHGRLAPLLIEADQQFVRATDFRTALQEEADRLEALRSSDGEPAPELLVPPTSSLICRMYEKAWGKPPQPRSAWRSKPTGESSVGNIAKEFNRAMDYVKAHPEKYKQRPPWPHL